MSAIRRNSEKLAGAFCSFARAVCVSDRDLIEAMPQNVSARNWTVSSNLAITTTVRAARGVYVPKGTEAS